MIAGNFIVEENHSNPKKHRPAVSRWYNLPPKIVSTTPPNSGNRTHNFSCDRHCLHKWI
jgi:hypothetical protein